MKNLLLFCLALALAAPLFAQGQFFDPVQNKQLPDLDNTRFFRTDKAWISEVTDHKGLVDHLAQAPHETAASAKNGQVIELPNPDGEITTFRIVRYTMVHPSVQALLPDLVTAYGEDTEGKGMRLSLSYTNSGISAMVRGGRNGRWMIDPVFAGDNRYHQSFYTKDSPATVARECLVEDDVRKQIDRGEPLEEKIIDDCRLRTHKLAMACTGEYFDYMVNTHGDAVNDRSANDYTTVFDRIIVSINRVNQIYREDIALVFTLVNMVQADTIQLLYNDPATDPYDNFDTNQLTNVNSGISNTVIGEANYDLGHVFSTSFGGLAGPGICFDDNQASGATGLPAPETDAFDVDFVAHELGHQLGANHTFNGEQGSCGSGNRNGATAFEPSSGTTIMAYAGICSSDNIQMNSDPYFNIISLEEINTEMQAVFSNYNPGGCAVFSTGNMPPTIDAGDNYSIPLNTPFVLTAAASNDPDGGTLTYCWEQYFTAPTTALSGEPTGAETNTPLFRSRPPVLVPHRYFPSLENIANRIANPTGFWESLPTTAQTLTFNVTARDGITNGGYGCPQADRMEVTFVDTGSPFAVIFPEGGEGIPSGGMTNVTWDVAGTTANPINCSNVDILLSTDGGLTYPQTLVATTPNDGSASVTLPAITTTTARIMVRCSDKIFFNVSDTDFAIEETDFTIAGNLNQATICSGVNEAAFSVDVASTQGYTGSIDLSATAGLPAGATVTFSVDPVVFNGGNINTTQTVTVTIGNLAGAANGDYNIIIQGDDGFQMKTTNLSLNVGTGPITLTSPDDNGQVAVADANSVSLGFRTLDGYESYRADYTLTTSGGGIGSAFSTKTFGSNPGVTDDNFDIDLSGSADDGSTVTWTITATDTDGSLTQIVSCTRTFTFVTVLPVTWLDFNARPAGKTALLNWSVEQDELNAGFAIERNDSGTNNWNQIGYVQRAGADGVANYQFTDEQVAAGSTYHYRLRQEDTGAASTYSVIRTVAFDAAFGLTVVPNPANDFVLLNAGTTQDNLQYALYDPAGRKVSEGTMSGGQVRINMSQLSAAVYQVLVTDGAGYREVVRVVKR